MGGKPIWTCVAALTLKVTRWVCETECKWDMKKCIEYKQSHSVKTHCFRNIIKIQGLFIDCDY